MSSRGPSHRRSGVMSALLATALILNALVPSPVRAQGSGQEILDRTVGLTMEEVTLEEAFREIQRTLGISFVYSPDLIPANRPVSCPCQESTLREALRTLLRGTGLVFRATQTQVRILPAPRREDTPTVGIVAGVVSNREDGLAIPNALVQLSDGRGGLTNEHGRFILVNVPPGTYSLRVTGLGWAPADVAEIRVTAGNTSTVSVTLTRRAIPLSAIIISPGTFGVLDEVSDFALQTLTREQIETVPQVGEDVFRSLKRLPGVASGDISTRLHLRGGTDREVMVLLDGMELYEPYHLKDFEGALGIVDINAVGSIDLHTGGFGVDFGDYMAGVFAMETRAPPNEGMRTTLGLSLTNATLMSQGAFADGRGQWLFSGRRGYMDIVLNLTDANDDLSPRYYDFLGKVQYQLGSKHLLSGHLLYARDDLRLDPEALADDDTSGELSTAYGNAYGWLSWKAYFSPRVRARTVASAGRVSRSRIGNMLQPDRVVGPEALDVHDEAGFDFVGLAQDWTVDFTDLLAARFGASAKQLKADYDYSHWTRTLEATAGGDVVGVYDSVRVDLDPDGTELSAFAALRFRPVPRVTGEVGLRYDRHSYSGDSDISPRVHALVDMGDNTTLRGAWGQYHQSQGIHQLEASDAETVFSPSERATQLALGVEHRTESGISGRVEFYQRKVERPLRQYFNRWREILPFPEIDGDRIRLEPTEARARGMEMLVQHDGPVWDWSAGYTLSSTEDMVGGEWYPRFIDQRHALSLTVGFRPSSNWTVTGAWHLHSGWPFTPQLIRFDTISVFQDEGLASSLRWREEFGPLNSSNLPAYHRLDLRVTRKFALRKGNLDIYLDLFNAYNQENLRSFDYGTQVVGNDFKYVRYPDETLLPFLPSIGFRWEF